MLSNYARLSTFDWNYELHQFNSNGKYSISHSQFTTKKKGTPNIYVLFLTLQFYYLDRCMTFNFKLHLFQCLIWNNQTNFCEMKNEWWNKTMTIALLNRLSECLLFRHMVSLCTFILLFIHIQFKRELAKNEKKNNTLATTKQRTILLMRRAREKWIKKIKQNFYSFGENWKQW